MEKEKIPKLNTQIEKINPQETQEQSKEILSLLEKSEWEIDTLAEAEQKKSDKITQRFITLGATKEEIEIVTTELKKADTDIEEVKETSMEKLFNNLGEFYVDNIKDLDKSVLAEIKIRPINSKYQKLKKKIEKSEQVHGRYFGGYRNIVDDAKLLSQYSNLVSKKLEDSVEKDIKTYTNINQYRKFKDTLRSPLRDYSSTTAESKDLSALYAMQLNKVKNNFDDPEKLKEVASVYFSPSTIVYQNQHFYRENTKLNKEEAREQGKCYVHSILERIDAFSEYVLKDKNNLSNEQKYVLQGTVVDILENQNDDISRNIYEVKKLIKFADLCEFSNDQKKLIHKSVLNLLIKHKDREGKDGFVSYLSSYDMNLSLDTEDQNKVFVMLEKEGMGTKVNILKKDILSKEQKTELINQLTSNGTFEELLKNNFQDNIWATYDLIEEAEKFGLIAEDAKVAVIQKAYEFFIEKRNFSYLIGLQSKYEKCLSQEQNSYIKIVSRIYNSPSKTLKNLASEIAQQLLNKEVLPTEIELDEELKKIEEVFVKNNIPYVGKQFKVFQILYPDKRFKGSFKGISSPELASHQNLNEKRLILFKDLLKINIRSLNGDLKNYLNILSEGSEILNKYESNAELNEDEKLQLIRFLKKINTLADNIKTQDKNHTVTDQSNIDSEISRLRESFGVRENENLIDKFNRTFLQRIGIKDVNEALRYFDLLREQTDFRNRNRIKDNKIEIENGDLVKAVHIEFFDQLLERGVVSPEFIGAETSEAKNKSSQSDDTPWDTDLIKYSKSVKNFFSSNTSGSTNNMSLTYRYGGVMLLMKNRGQFNETNNKEKVEETKNNQMELFSTSVIDKSHVGIRTGFPSTEIDAIVLSKENVKDGAILDSLRYYIARKGFYIPICKESGEVVFTPEEFDKYRNVFNGIDQFSSKPVEISDKWEKTKFADEINQNIAKPEEKQEVISIRKDLVQEFKSVLGDLNIKLHGGELDDSIVGAQILDTGSTARGSNLEKDYDFDFVVKIDENDYSQVSKIIEKLKDKFPLNTQYEVDSVVTARFKDVPFNNKIIDLDVSFSKKSEISGFDTDKAIIEKYESIKDTYGEEKLEKVLANIRFAKKKLIEYKAYKKGTNEDVDQQGGLGGIGVETWILQHNGDAVEAFKEFYNAAHENGKLLSFDKFKEKYKIFGAGENIRGKKEPENFTRNLTEKGYKKTARVAREIMQSA